MLEKACQILKAVGNAEKLIKILTAIRVTVFVAALIYAVTSCVSLIKKAYYTRESMR